MKTLVLFLLAVLTQNVSGQSLYEIKFKGPADTTHYTCLLVYYNENDAYARTAFFHRGQYRVVETKYKGTRGKQNDGKEYFALTGTDPVYITEKSRDESYNPDYFVWIGDTEIPYTTDKEPDSLTGVRKVFQAEDYIEIEPSALTEEYLRSFYNDQEEDYIAFRQMNGDLKNWNDVENNFSTTLHLIIVANTSISDIGAGCKTDVEHLTNEFEDIASTLKIRYDPVTITGAAFTKVNLVEAIADLHVGEDDIVIFIYRGHGFRWSNQTSAYPSLAITKSHAIPVSDENTILLESIYNSIILKGGRLNVVMGDCCNSSIGIPQMTSNNFLYMQSNAPAVYAKLSALFLNQKGNLIFAASQRGEVSWTNDMYGGFFTSSFLQALSEERLAI
jgi:hypothetical protein